MLKPNDEYGGKGIVLGWEVDDADVGSGDQAALAEPYIVQQRSRCRRSRIRASSTARSAIVDRMVDTAPYVAYGDHVDGCLTRLGTASLLNVTAGGGIQRPTFVVERREPVSLHG